MSVGEDAGDAHLVEAALKGENNAFSAIMSRHKEALYRFIRVYVGDADEALDITQETFVAAWSALDRFDQRRSLGVWLRRIALNKCRDWARRRKVRSFFFRAVSLEEAPNLSSRSLAHSADDKDPKRMSDLDAAIAALPAPLKESLLLTVFEQMTQQEAAELLGVSVKAVETRIYRAKQQLRRFLDSADR